MNKEVKGLLCEIVVLLFIIVINLIIWPNLREEHLKKTDAVMSYVNNLSIEVINREEYYLFPMTDEYAINNLNKNTIELVNYDKNLRKYILYLKIDNSSNVDINSLSFMFNDNIIDFNKVYSYEDDNYIYYQVYSGVIKEKEYIDYIFWLKSDSEITNIKFTYSFEVI